MQNRLFKEQLHVRLAVVIAVVGAVVSLIGSYIVFELSHTQQQRFSHHFLNQIAESTAKTASVAVYVNDEELANEITNSLLHNDMVIAARITSENRVVAQSNLLPRIQPISVALRHPFIDTEITGKLDVYPDEEFIQKMAFNDARHSALEMLMVSLCLTMTMYFVVYQFLSRPLVKLFHAFEEVDLTHPEQLKEIDIHYNKRDEIGFLVKGTNALISAVKVNFTAERTLRLRTEELERRFRLLFDKASIGIGLVSLSNGVLLMNPVFEQIVGGRKSMDELVKMFEEPHKVYRIISDLASYSVVSPITVDLSVRLNGKKHWLNCLFASINDDRASPRGADLLFEVILNDVTERKERETKAKYLANHDALTGLLNRHGGETKLRGLVASSDHAELTAIMLIDLDKFKPVNDTFGHEAGDVVLLESANRLKVVFDQPSDVWVRWGGDEFVVGFSRFDAKDVHLAKLCRQLLDLIEQPIQIAEGQECQISASIGTVIVKSSTQTLEDVLSKADELMYDVKRQGRASYLITE